MTFSDFFRAATGHVPHRYQARLACGDPDAAGGAVLDRPDPGGCRSRVIVVPTGLGKTSAVTLAWMWNRMTGAPKAWPRRMVYCLPMRVLVEQTVSEMRRWLMNLRGSADALGLSFDARRELAGLVESSPVVLLGGEAPDRDWDLAPERPTILVGTQDMLLSRALNRGYGVSRARWPVHFGWLNNDALWVLDETQLMGVGLETSVQLAGLRERFTSLGGASWWMTATPDPRRLGTPEAPARLEAFALDESELAHEALRRRREARKRLVRAETVPGESGRWSADLAREVLEAHISGSLTLVVLNRVERAQALQAALRDAGAVPEILLLHGRFRPHEREPIVRRLLEGREAIDRIVVATQVVEAGVDLSARTLFTEVAPWASLVQRFGRCHRHGELGDGGGTIRWLDVAVDDPVPYRAEELALARKLLAGLNDASPASLARIQAPPLPEPARHVLRPRDLRELFDTTADLGGADLDVSRFIRDGDDTDAQIFWRDAAPTTESEGPARGELCSVPVGRLRDFAEKHRREQVWTWDYLMGGWTQPERFLPGRVYWLHAGLGGYDPRRGFDPGNKAKVEPVPVATGSGHPEDSDEQESGTITGPPETLAEHTANVVGAAEELLTALAMPEPWAKATRRAAAWHDVGKAHPVFQAALRKANPGLAEGVLWAKSGVRAPLRFERRRFRHELASALALLAHDGGSGPVSSLAAYLVAAHHGKVRLALRSLPDENEPSLLADGTERLFARGVWEGDELPAVEMACLSMPPTALSLSVMAIGLDADGRSSWLERSLALRDDPDLGPFCLAYLEAVLRAADARASRPRPAGDSLQTR